MYPLGPQARLDGEAYETGSLDCRPDDEARGSGRFIVPASATHPLATTADAARAAFTGVTSSDVVKVKRVRGPGDWARVLRGARVIAIARLEPEGKDWRVELVALCMDEGIGFLTAR